MDVLEVEVGYCIPGYPYPAILTIPGTWLVTHQDGTTQTIIVKEKTND